jgi:fructose-1,6-bisphosphatase I
MDLQRMHPEATGDLSGLLNELIVAAKTISAEVNMAGLADVLGMSGKVNIQGEEVQKLDEFSNNTIKTPASTPWLSIPWTARQTSTSM